MSTNDIDLIACTHAALSREGWTTWFSVWHHRESISANNEIKTYISISEKCLSIFSLPFISVKHPRWLRWRALVASLWYVWVPPMMERHLIGGGRPVRPVSPVTKEPPSVLPHLLVYFGQRSEKPCALMYSQLQNLHGNQHNNEGWVSLSQCTVQILRHSSNLSTIFKIKLNEQVSISTELTQRQLRKGREPGMG